MKKLFIAILFFISATTFCNGQISSPYPVQQALGNNPNTVVINNAIRSRTFILNYFDDTTAINSYSAYLKTYPFAITATYNDSSIWFRWNGMWVKLGGAGGGSTGSNWAIGGNYFVNVPIHPWVGTNSPDNFQLAANGIVRLIIPLGGIVRSSAAVNKYLMMDTTTKLMYYGDATGSTNSNVGSGYRWVIPNTNNIKTITATNGLTPDSATSNQIGVKLGGTLTGATDVTMGGQTFRFFNASDKFVSYNGTDLIMKSTAGYKFDVQISGSNASELYASDDEMSMFTQSGSEGTTAKLRANQDLVEAAVSAAYPGGNDQASARADYDAGANDLSASLVVHPVSSINYGFNVDRNLHQERIGMALGINNNNFRGIRIDSLWQVFIDSLTNLSTQDQLIGIVNSSGKLGQVTVGTGLSLTSGNLTATGVPSVGSQGQILQVSNGAATWKYDTTTLVTFSAGARLPGDTALFTDSTLYGSFYLDGNDTLIITKVRAVLNGGTSDTLGYNIWYNDTINVIGSPMFSITEPVNSTTTGNLAENDDYTGGSPPFKIPPGNWVWLKTPTVVPGRRPHYLSISLIGYKKRVN